MFVLPGLWRRFLSQQLETGPWSVWRTGSWLRTDWGWGSDRWAHRSAPSASGSPINTESGREVDRERDKCLDHTSVSAAIMLVMKKCPLLKPHSTHTTKLCTSCTSASSKHSNLFWQHLQDVTWVICVLQNKLLPCFVWCVMKSSMIKLPLSADKRSVCFSPRSIRNH